MHGKLGEKVESRNRLCYVLTLQRVTANTLGVTVVTRLSTASPTLTPLGDLETARRNSCLSCQPPRWSICMFPADQSCVTSSPSAHANQIQTVTPWGLRPESFTAAPRALSSGCRSWSGCRSCHVCRRVCKDFWVPPGCTAPPLCCLLAAKETL